MHARTDMHIRTLNETEAAKGGCQPNVFKRTHYYGSTSY